MTSVAAAKGRVSMYEWRARVLTEAALQLGTETIALVEADQRDLAAAMLAPEDVPNVPVAAMDGFAVRFEDLGGGAEDETVTLPVSVDLPARPGVPAPLTPGTAARIMTGAPVPAGADTVVEVERTDAEPVGPLPAQVTIQRDRKASLGRHVRSVGEEIRQGEELAAAATRLGPGMIGLALALGITEVTVRRRARVGIVVTGDELADPAAPAAPGTVRESNGALLAAAVRADGGEARTARCGDDTEAFCRVLEDLSRQSDLLVTTGGVGHGAYDVVKAALGPTGRGTSTFEHLALRPGGPQGLGAVGGVPVVHLPGTPVGVVIAYHLFLRPLLDARFAHDPWPAQLIGADPESGRASRRPGVLVQPGLLQVSAEGQLGAQVVPGKRLAPFSTADCLVLREGEGSRVHVIPLR